MLLALVAQKIEGKTFPEIINERISVPYHLTSMKALLPSELPQNLALAHKNGVVEPTVYSLPLGAGSIVSNAADMSLLLYNLLCGKILPKHMVCEMLKDLYSMFNNKFEFYGDAIMFYDFSVDNQPYGMWIGHAGGTENYNAIVAYQAKLKSFVAVSISQKVPAEAVAFRIQAILK